MAPGPEVCWLAVSITEMSERVLVRALEPFPIAVRTLDALHLATMQFLHGQGEGVALASYDNRLVAAALALSIALALLCDADPSR